ncbi:hypothetical protein DIE03_03330 [Burkholderia sp. Bp8992]|nr:hypothetical protein DIE03_03330 [Burkholderia sp. Bp8992]
MRIGKGHVHVVGEGGARVRCPGLFPVWDPHRSAGDFASTVILKRWKRIGFAGDGEWPLPAFKVASQV